MVNLISDYKGVDGVFYHRAQQVTGTEDPTSATTLVLANMLLNCETPAMVVQVHGDYSLSQLSDLASSDIQPMPDAYTVTYMDYELMMEE